LSWEQRLCWAHFQPYTGRADLATARESAAEENSGKKDAEAGKSGEELDLPGLEEKIGGKEFLLEEYGSAISRVIEEVNPVVVNIRVMVTQENIFGERVQSEGLGSGVIYTEDGYIITNNHVAGPAEEIAVTLYDGTEYPAELVAGDENTDIAVVKIDPGEELKAASFISIDDVNVGELAIAVGSPFGLQQTVTTGVISAKGRDITLSADTIPMVNLIQTDTAINQGNSGGPLINSSGQVIGINTLILSASGGSSGIGFAIPSDTAVNIADQIIEYGRAKIPYEMGINETDVAGVYVVGVMEGYPASKAGLRSGDVIVEFDGTTVKTPFELFAEMLRSDVGDRVELKVYRDGEYMIYEMVMAEAPYTENTERE